MQAITPLSLLELNGLVRQTIDHAFAARTYWLQAELSGVSERGGHCFVDFVQKGERDNAILAQARATVWASRWAFLRPYFQQATGQALAAGMQVLAEVKVTFHERYGYALSVLDIDPTYTLGDLARRRREILQTLRSEGVADMNKELPLPRLLQRIAVISSPNAAGLQDFLNQLDHNPRRLRFTTRLFEAVMQGQQVEPTVVAALQRIADEMDLWDAVVIIRGGGSATDLSGFDTLELAENVAQFPLPVITGIGHERDDTVIDLVAHTRVKTPTAAAEFLIRHQQAELDTLLALADTLHDRVSQWLTAERQRLSLLTARMPAAARLLVSDRAARLQRQQAALSDTARQAVYLRRNRLALLSQRLNALAESLLTAQRHRLSLRETAVSAADPARLLRLGFSVTRLNGHALTDPAALGEGDELVTTLAQGTVTSRVCGSSPHTVPKSH